jgi:glycosyltransferase involved in cell wall biosynthesis
VRACHVIHALSPGGAEQVLVDLARAAPAAGLDLSVISLMAFDASSVHLPALREQGVPVVSLGLTTRWDPRAFRRADVAVRRLRPDVLHTHLKHADLVGAAVARQRGLPLVSTLHVIEDAPEGIGRLKRAAARAARDRVATRTIAVSQAQRSWYVERLGGNGARTVVVRNGVPAVPPADSSMRAEVRAELGVPPEGVLVLTPAVMRPEKGLSDLLEAVTLLPSGTDLHLVLVGDGPERAALETQAAGHPEASRRVRFAGWRDDVAGLLPCADVVAHPSHADALPTALLQATAAGVPVVATSVGGTPEAVAPGAAVLVPPRDPAALAGALAELAGDPGRRAEMARRARAWHEQELRVDLWARRLARVYEEVLGEHQRPPAVAR